MDAGSRRGSWGLGGYRCCLFTGRISLFVFFFLLRFVKDGGRRREMCGDGTRDDEEELNGWMDGKKSACFSFILRGE